MTNMIYFNRTYDCKITNLKTGYIKIVTGLRMSFQYQKDTDSESGKGMVTIYNLSDSSRKALTVKGNKGLKINNLRGLTNKYEYFFGEDQARYIVEIPKENIEEVTEILNKNSVHFDEFGIIREKNLTFNGDINLPIEELSDAHKYWMKDYMEN